MNKSIVNLLDDVAVLGGTGAFSEKKTYELKQHSGDRLLGDLVCDHRYISASTSFGGALDSYQEQPGLIPVVNDKVLVGVIREKALLQGVLDQTAGKEIKLADYIEPAQVVLSSVRSVRSVTLDLKKRHISLGNEPLPVANPSGEYIGLVDSDILLTAISELYQDQKRYANPLTGLPGRVMVDETVVQLTKDSALFVVAHVGVNDLHAYNGSYGYSKGDQVIQQVASVLESVCDRESDCLAHLHGGRFTLVFRSPDWFDRCESAINMVDKLAHHYYSKSDQRDEGVTTLNRLGERDFAPFFSLSIGAVPVYPGKFDSCHEIFSAASEVESRASQTYGGAIYVDQRNYRSDMGELTVRLS